MRIAMRRMIVRRDLNDRRDRRVRSADGDAGFTLLELLVALGIIVLIATIAAPQVLRYLGGARTETAKAQISSLSTALELYALDNGGFPSDQAGLRALVAAPGGNPRWKGPYIKRASGIVDPWGQPYRYRRIGRGGQPDIYTLGRDNAPGGAGEDQDVTN
jgi:general secretion pathway protein G